MGFRRLLVSVRSVVILLRRIIVVAIGTVFPEDRYHLVGRFDRRETFGEFPIPIDLVFLEYSFADNRTGLFVGPLLIVRTGGKSQQHGRQAKHPFLFHLI